MSNINQLVRTFFNDINFEKESAISVVRNDGIVVYSTIDNEMDKASIGALVSGLWQAAFSISTFVDKTSLEDSFRLTFDTSNSGINIIPLKINKKYFFFCSLYKNNLNPAKFKQKMKIISAELERYIQSEFKEDTSQKNRPGYLFQNITDEEMDSLFNFN